MSSGANIKERLEFLKTYMYEELNHLKAEVHESLEETGKDSATLSDGHKPAGLDVFKPTKHQRSYKRSGRRALHRKY